jgi:hypothetical protein
MKCWGWNFSGQLGNGSTISSGVPVDVAGLTSPIAAISAGDAHTCALTIYGVAKCWGYNVSGQLGNGTVSDSTLPVQVTGLNGGVAELSAGGVHTCAVMAGGGVKCWGYNAFGQLGDGTMADRRTPVNVVDMPGGARVSAGAFHTCVLTVQNGVECWGQGDSGQLGNGATTGPQTCAGIVACSTTPVSVFVDTDHDGCVDAREAQTETGSQGIGGLRNPKDFWDFMDQWIGGSRDKVVSDGDIGSVVARFGTSGDSLGNPLTPPVSTTGYHVIADRNGAYPGQRSWNLQPPNGSISGGDIAAVVAQFGHSCM